MYIIVVYDVEEKRVSKVCQYLRRHLFWVQRSVFEGDVSEGRLEKMKAGLRRIINPRHDSIYIYKVRDQRWVSKEVLGVEAAPMDQII
jgi:CRISPR-associated protein Cas2